MEEGLLLKEKEKGRDDEIEKIQVRWKEVLEEMIRVSWVAGPMVAVLMSQYMIQVVTLMMVGHLGPLYLSSTALAVSLAAVTGFSLLLGMAGALETLSGQSYGAQQYKKLGTQTYTAIISLTLFSIPLSVIWIYMEDILVFIGQDPSISHEAGRFMTYLVPTLISYAVFQPLVRYFQSQSLVVPMLVSSCCTLCLHIPLCWALVHKFGLKNIGGAMAMGISNWLNAIFLALFMMFSPSCAATRSPLSMEMFHGIGLFFRFAIPSASMICLEWWSFELLILLSGFLPNPELETSVLSVCLTTISALFAIPYGIAAAASTRIANELGAGNPQAARVAACGVVVMGVTNGLIVSSILFATRRVFGYCFSNEKQVVDYVFTMAPLICANVIFDSIQAVLSGVARGCGWQHLGTYANLAAYYLVGIPISVTLGFWMQMRGRGLWMGVMIGAMTQAVLLSIITSRTNWEEEARKARKRVAEESSGVSNGEQRPLIN
ncbi:protein DETOXIFICATION 14-like isoform X1 [Chenopodium quinoa]|uniref:protein DETOXIFICATION 14-like isoform X1 n=2 Tax=Chenopodium quinoa TaxID=63459 RepID=UPI000B78CF42|nr:protein DETOXIFICATION 14-like isoform X1 [Chenopodium quinoa]